MSSLLLSEQHCSLYAVCSVNEQYFHYPHGWFLLKLLPPTTPFSSPPLCSLLPTPLLHPSPFVQPSFSLAFQPTSRILLMFHKQDLLQLMTCIMLFTWLQCALWSMMALRLWNIISFSRLYCLASVLSDTVTEYYAIWSCEFLLQLYSIHLNYKSYWYHHGCNAFCLLFIMLDLRIDYRMHFFFRFWI